MRRFPLALVILLPAATPAADWPAWRGPSNDGVSTESTPFPIRWSTTENIAWKTEIPGVGHSSPIVCGQRIFLTSCLEKTGERLLICLDRASGKILWQRVVVKAPLERKHALNSYSSSTPATDGQYVWITFLDQPNIVVACYDYDGKQKWRSCPGKFNSPHGFCSSPILYENLVIVNCDQDNQEAFLVAYEKTGGDEVWRTDRPNRVRSYCVPIIVDATGKKQLVLSGSKCVASYDPATGKQHWIIHGPTEQYVASLVYAKGVLFLTAGYPELWVMGIKPDGEGDVTKTHVLWSSTKAASYVPSPVAYRDLFFLVSDGGVASCFEPVTGKRYWMERLGKHHSASLVAAGGYVYCLDDAGTTHVLMASEKFEVVAVNPLKEECYASPALADGQIFVRGVKHLYCIGEKKN